MKEEKAERHEIKVGEVLDRVPLPEDFVSEKNYSEALARAMGDLAKNLGFGVWVPYAVDVMASRLIKKAKEQKLVHPKAYIEHIKAVPDTGGVEMSLMVPVEFIKVSVDLPLPKDEE